MRRNCAKTLSAYHRDPITTGNWLAASRTGLSAKWAYRAVVCGCVCPNSLPTMGKDTPLETRCEANECRRS
jgi:hypothetical protein